MKVGDMAKWSWYLGTDWEETQVRGIIVSTRLWKTEHEEVNLLSVLLTDGDLVEIREDQSSLELLA